VVYLLYLAEKRQVGNAKRQRAWQRKTIFVTEEANYKKVVSVHRNIYKNDIYPCALSNQFSCGTRMKTNKLTKESIDVIYSFLSKEQ